MPLALLVLLLGGAVLEVWVAVRLADAIGALPVVLLLIGSSLLGTRVLSRGAVRAWRRVADAARDGDRPGRRVVDTGIVVVAGVLLLLPGLISGAVGALFLLPPAIMVLVPVGLILKEPNLGTAVITGIVGGAESGDPLFLQSIRLSMVMRLADCISRSICLGMRIIGRRVENFSSQAAPF